LPPTLNEQAQAKCDEEVGIKAEIYLFALDGENNLGKDI
jgi:hypothetical protein